MIITDGPGEVLQVGGDVAARAEIAQSTPEDLRHTGHSVHGQRERSPRTTQPEQEGGADGKEVVQYVRENYSAPTLVTIDVGLNFFPQMQFARAGVVSWVLADPSRDIPQWPDHARSLVGRWARNCRMASNLLPRWQIGISGSGRGVGETDPTQPPRHDQTHG